MTPGFRRQLPDRLLMVPSLSAVSPGLAYISRFAPHKFGRLRPVAMLLCLISAFSGGHIGAAGADVV